MVSSEILTNVIESLVHLLPSEEQSKFASDLRRPASQPDFMKFVVDASYNLDAGRFAYLLYVAPLEPQYKKRLLEANMERNLERGIENAQIRETVSRQLNRLRRQ